MPLEAFDKLRVPVQSILMPHRISPYDLELLMTEAERCRNGITRPIIELALETAMRRGELCSLRWSQIDFERSLINLPDTKSGYPRIIPLSPVAMSLLNAVSERRTGDLVFGLTTNALRMSFCRVRKRANLRCVRFHDLRHEAISRLFEKGLTPPEVAMISGHRTMSMLMRYSHASIDVIGAKLQSDIGVTLG